MMKQTDHKFNRKHIVHYLIIFFLMSSGVCVTAEPEQEAGNDNGTDPFVRVQNLNKIKPFRNQIKDQKNQGSAIYRWNMKSGESLFVGIQKISDKEVLRPLAGYEADTHPADRMHVVFAIHPPGTVNIDDPKWTIFIGDSTSDGTSGSVSGDLYNPTSIKQYDQVENIEPIFVPVNIPETKIYMMPIRKVKGKIQNIVLAITKDRQELNKAINVNPGHETFNWSDWFTKLK